MIKNILHAVLFIALVALVAYLFAYYAPGLAPGSFTNTGEYVELKTVIDIKNDLAVRIDELQAKVVELENELTSLVQQPPAITPVPDETTPPPEKMVQDHSLVLLEVLNCKIAASQANSHRLLLGLGSLEILIENVPGDISTLQREIYLARTETAAGINSAVERLEIIWRLLLSVLTSQTTY